MPIVAGIDHADRLAVAHVVGKHQNLRRFRDDEFGGVMRLDLAETPGEGDLVLRRYLLAANGNDLMVVKRLLDLRKTPVIERPGQVNAEDLRGHDLGQGIDRYAHRASSLTGRLR